jgi:hypothetical protein
MRSDDKSGFAVLGGVAIGAACSFEGEGLSVDYYALGRTKVSMKSGKNRYFFSLAEMD